jgi:excisionase family DNA binding protein
MTPNTPAAQRLLTAEELAERWQVKPPFVYRLAREGAIPKVPIGDRTVRFRLSAIEAWEAAQEGGKAA